MSKAPVAPFKKSTAATVFVRFHPPSDTVHRRHLEELFSDIGPIKKCSVIQSSSGAHAAKKSCGFVKFLTDSDARQAANQLNTKTFRVDDQTYTLKVELASDQTKTKEHQQQHHKSSKKDHSTKSPTTPPPTTTGNNDNNYNNKSRTRIDDDALEETPEELLAKRKRTCRVMVRNLSFYAKENDVKSTLEREFGPVLEIQLPRVNETTHRGFCFVTFAHAKDAHACTMPRTTPLMIKQRAVAMDYAISKRVHQQQQQQQEQVKKINEEDQQDESSQEGDDEDVDKDEDGSGSEAEEKEENDDKEEEDEEEGDDDDEDDDDQDDANETPEKDDTKLRRQAPVVDEGVSRQQTIFMRNLPFDTTRHDIFQLMHKFGHVESIFLVKDKDTGVFKGTAFVQYKTKEAAARAMECSSGKEFTSQKEGSDDTGGLQLNGRRVYCDYAVDKSTASTLTLEQEEKVTGKDRRNMYLKTEGRVANQADLPGNVDNSAWESLPESDQLKRQNAFMEKNTKLRSPLFFINPKRLSIRNLAKHVDEVQLKKLVVEATIKGLSRSLVNQDDQVAHWRASGDMTTREILKRMETSTEPIIPVLDEKNIKESIPSVFIDRDFTTKKSEVGQSRGFGFVDFTHHVHALACLRQLNNNPKYSIEYVTSGKKGNAAAKELASGEAGGGRKAPRLIVDFTVENKAKAKKQAEHRAQQQANREAQKLEHKAKTAESKGEKKQSRGALQREKKRKAKDEIVVVKPVAKVRAVPKAPVQAAAPKVKLVKPPKKRKLDSEEQTFERLVQSYTESFSSTIKTADDEEQANVKPKKSEKRWFE